MSPFQIEQRAFQQTLSWAEAYLQSLADLGITGFDCRQAAIETVAGWGEPQNPLVETLESVRADLGDCRRCKLCQHRRHIVYGVGTSRARLVFVGEGPGRDEDLQGRPFVGAAGKLLTNIIHAMGLTRQEVYICNIIKCRPPGNRNPEADEIATCLPFLNRQIAAIDPEFVCALGTVAAQTLLKTSRRISVLRGCFHDVKGFKLMPTYHPAYLLRNPAQKRAVWEDMKLLLNAMGLPSAPARGG